jgi:hypothetical protein
LYAHVFWMKVWRCKKFQTQLQNRVEIQKKVISDLKREKMFLSKEIRESIHVHDWSLESNL